MQAEISIQLPKYRRNITIFSAPECIWNNHLELADIEQDLPRNT